MANEPTSPHWTSAALGSDRTAARGVLFLLLTAGAVLILLHVSLKVVGEPANMMFDLAFDRGYGEFFQYVQTIWAGAMLVLLAARRRAPVFAAWAAVCGFLLLDDWLQLHEWFGPVFASIIGQGQSAVIVGELIWLGTVGALLFAGVAPLHLRAREEALRVSAVLVVLFGLLVLFGVVVDAVHHAFLEHPVLAGPLALLEDGGELIVMSLIVSFLFAVAFAGHSPRLGRRLAVLARGRHSDPLAPEPITAQHPRRRASGDG